MWIIGTGSAGKTHSPVRKTPNASGVYARSLGERQVYTPQAIINGRTHLVGSRKADIRNTADDFTPKTARA